MSGWLTTANRLLIFDVFAMQICKDDSVSLTIYVHLFTCKNSRITKWIM